MFALAGFVVRDSVVGELLLPQEGSFFLWVP